MEASPILVHVPTTICTWSISISIRSVSFFRAVHQTACLTGLRRASIFTLELNSIIGGERRRRHRRFIHPWHRSRMTSMIAPAVEGLCLLGLRNANIPSRRELYLSCLLTTKLQMCCTILHLVFFDVNNLPRVSGHR